MTQLKTGQSKRCVFNVAAQEQGASFQLCTWLKVDGKCGKLQGIGSVVTKAGEQDQEGWEPRRR